MLLEQMVSFIPASTIGLGVTLIIKLSLVELQLPLLVEVNFMLTVPIAISAGLN
jgi:hypothetical protein